MSSLPHGITDKPHPVEDECMPCGLRGWDDSTHRRTSDGTPVTVAEGYGEFEGYVLVAEGHLDDTYPIEDGDFRASSTSRRVLTAGELSFAD